MNRAECYTHTRNYGCRLRRYLWNGVEMLSLENQKVKVVDVYKRQTQKSCVIVYL